MDALLALTDRHSTRLFSSTPVTKPVLEQIVDAGHLAATAKNLQPWVFVVVTEAATRRRIADMTEFGKFIADAPACIAVFCQDSTYYLEDGAAATQNMLVAAQALGLASCWVSGDKSPHAQPVAQLLGAPSSHKLVSLVALGHEQQAGSRRPKKTLQEVIRWETFSLPSSPS